MQRLRTTFKRSRTPTGAEMKTQSSLEVPKQVRSASFDEIQLEAKRNQANQDEGANQALFGGLLKVPHFNNQRSRSVDSGGSEDSVTYLEVPRRFQRRRSSNTKSPACVHCVCLEEYLKRRSIEDDATDPPAQVSRSFSFSSDTSNDSSEDRDNRIDSLPECNITVILPELPPPPPSPIELVLPPIDDSIIPKTLMELMPRTAADFLPEQPKDLLIPNLSSPVQELKSPTDDLFDEAPASPRERRRSIQRQEAFFTEPTGNSLDNVSDATSEVYSEATTSDGLLSEGVASEGDATAVGAVLSVRDIYLTVPELKRDRAVSVDSCFSKVSSSGKTEELQHSGVSLEVPVSPNVTLRSRSVDIVLPTNEQARYKALAMTNAASQAAAGDRSQHNSALKGYVEVFSVDRKHVWCL